MMTCPNKNLKEWGEIVSSRGENEAYFLWNKYGGKVPRIEYASDVTTKEVEAALEKSGAFNKKNGKYYLKKHRYPEAYNLIGLINSRMPGMVKKAKENYLGAGGREVEFVTVEQQLSAFQKQGTGNPIDSLNNIMIEFLTKAGFTLEETQEIVTSTGDSAIAHTTVKRNKEGLVKLVQFVKGKLKADTLPEEAAHVAVKLSLSNPITQRLLEVVDQSPEYAEVVAEYENEEGYDEAALREEAAGKIIAKQLVGMHSNKPAASKITRMVDAIIKWLSGKLRKVDEVTLEKEWDVLAKNIAVQMVSGKVGGTVTEEMSMYSKEKPKVKPAKDREFTDADLMAFDDMFGFGEGFTVRKKKPMPAAIEAYITSALNTKALLERQLVEKHATENAKINSQIEKLDGRVQALKEIKVGTFAKLMEYAEHDLEEYANSIKAFDEVPDKVRFFHIAMSTLNAWSSLDVTIRSEDEKIQADIRKVSSEAKGLMKALEDLAMEYLNTLGKSYTKEDFWQVLEGTSTWDANMLTIANSHIPEFRYAYHVVEKAGFFADQKHLENIKKVDALEAKFKAYASATGTTKEKLMERFYQVDSKGRRTGNLVGEYSQDYYDKKKELYKEAVKKKSFRAYYKWVKANTILTVIEERWQIAQENAKAEYTKADGTLDEEAYNKWFAEHDPDSTKSDVSKMREYARFEPRAELWADPKYTALKSPGNEQLFELYTEVMDFFKERRAMMPYASQPMNYLPEMSAGTQLWKDGMGGLIKAAGNGLKNYFSVELPMEKHYDPEDIRGERIKGVPVHMLAGVLTPEQKEMDIFKVMKAYDGVAQVYEFRAKTEPTVLLIKNLFRESKELVLNANGDPMTSNVTNKAQKLIGAHRNAMAALNYFMDATFYEEGKEAPDILAKFGEQKDAEGNIIDPGRGISLTRFGDILAEWTRRKAMGLNAFAGAVNAIFGLNTLLVHASGKEDFQTEHAYKAFRQCLALAAPGSMEYTKIMNIVRRYKLMPDINEVEKMKMDKVLFIFNEQTEKFIRAMTAISVMLATEVTVDGKKTNMFEALGKDGLNQIEGYADYTDGAHAFSSRVNALNDKLYGDYRNVKMFQANVWKRMAMVFRTWLPEAIEARIGKEKTDERLGVDSKGEHRKSKGRLRTFAQALTKSSEVSESGGSIDKMMLVGDLGKELMKQLANSFMFGKQVVNTENFEYMREIDRANMIKNVASFRMTLMIMTLGILLAGGSTDDDEERNKLLLFALTNTYRLQADMAFFLSPNQWVYMSENILPVTTLLSDIIAFGGAIPRAIMGDDEIEGGPYDGQSYLWRRFLKALPVSSQAIKWIDLENQNYDQWYTF